MRYKIRPRNIEPDRIGFWYTYDGLEFGEYYQGSYCDWLNFQGLSASDFFIGFTNCKEDARDLFRLYKDKCTRSAERARGTNKTQVSKLERKA